MNQATPASTLSVSGAETSQGMLCFVTQSVVQGPAVSGSFRNADSSPTPDQMHQNLHFNQSPK